VRATQSDALELADVDRALGLLPGEQREVLLLVAVEEMTYEEVSRALAIPIGTVMSRLSRGREALRQIMAGEDLPQLKRADA
jgi:RNA polymerase sigma-70 factor (ECF subfamily)